MSAIWFLRCGPPALTVAVLCATWCVVLGQEMTDPENPASRPTRCTYEHANDMYAALCVGLQLTEIPSLTGDIEILDFSNNKLRNIYKNTLSNYTSIKFLYLYKNVIINIDEDAFVNMTDLQTLDLSKNLIFSPPPNLLQLPSLRKLYLGGNPLLQFTLGLLAVNKDIRAPLEILDISDCKLKQLPEWGILSQLVFYNISYNPLISLNVKHFAVMCNLGKVDLTKAIEDIPLCSLKPAISWLHYEKKVYVQLDDYSKVNSKEFQSCPSTDIEAVHNNETFNRCKNEYVQPHKTV